MRAFRMAQCTFAVFPIVNAGVHNSAAKVSVVPVERSGAVFINNTIISKRIALCASKGALHVDCAFRRVYAILALADIHSAVHVHCFVISEI